MLTDPRTYVLLSIICLVVLAGIFAASEASLLALSRLRVVQDQNDRNGQTLLRLIDHRNKYLTTILVANTIILLASDSLATWLAIADGLWRPVLVATIAMTVAVLIFGEIVPKMIAVQHAYRYALRLAPLLNFFVTLLRPVTWTLIHATHWIIGLFGGDPNASGPYVTEDDIRAMVSAGEKHGVLEEDETEMIHSIFELGDTMVREVMTPRIDMVCTDVDEPVTTAVDLVIREGYSKLPVYEENIDHIIGVVHDRELLIAVSKGELQNPLRSFVRPIKAIPENKKVDELLREMQAEKVSVAIVVDEYGGTAGLVTMEDILEEIVGEIMDETDEAEQDRPPEFVELPNGEFIVDARMNIDDVNEELALSLPTEEFESIGGYTFGLFGRVPAVGEQVSIAGGLTLVVEKTAGRRLLSVRIKKPTNGTVSGNHSVRPVDGEGGSPR
ncbi:MAG: hemolysin family protein [Candidatus Eremiobacteraeota bacterium]|nr:hemolysin family protein [Candidatus Eremiobacteraeota bacterium]